MSQATSTRQEAHLTAHQACKILRIQRYALMRLALRGQIRVHEQLGHLRYDRDDVARLAGGGQ